MDKVTDSRRKDLARRYGLTGIGEGIALCHWCGKPGWMRWLPAERYDYWGALRNHPRPEHAVFEHEIDHVLARCRGGTNDLDNLVLACQPCNSARGHQLSRIRTIKPAFFRSLHVGGLPKTTRLTFIGLWTYVDDAGRGLDDTRLVKAELWPLDDDYPIKKVAADLTALAAITDCGQCPDEHGFICRYGDGSYFHVIHWDKHQKINRPQPSVLPPCPLHDPTRNGHGAVTADSVKAHGASSAGREGKGKGIGIAIDPLLLPHAEVAQPATEEEEDRDQSDNLLHMPSVAEAVIVVARRRLSRTPSTITDPEAWVRRTASNIIADLPGAVVAAAADGAPPLVLADLIDPPGSWTPAALRPGTVVPDLPAAVPATPLDAMATAAQEKYRRNDMPPCEFCGTRGGDGMVQRVDSLMVPCPVCSKPADADAGASWPS